MLSNEPLCIGGFPGFPKLGNICIALARVGINLLRSEGPQ
jgi:hypothetical protein